MTFARLAPLAAVTFAFLAACSSSSPSDDGPVTDEGELQNAKQVGKEFAAVGKLVLESSNSDGGDYFCTGALIAPNLVLTARHCVSPIGVDGKRGSFVVFPDDPSGTNYQHQDYDKSWAYSISRVLLPGTANDDSGAPMGLAGFGQDVGLLVLDEPVPADVATPLALRAAQLSDADVGKALTAVAFTFTGYGGSELLRVGGTMTLQGVHGQPFHRAFPTRAAYESHLAPYFQRMAGYADFESGKTAMLDFYDMKLSEPSFEVWAGNGKGDVQTCFGDSGGPLLDKVNGQWQVVGVVSAGSPMIGPYECVLGGSFISISPELRAAATRAKADSKNIGFCDVQNAKRDYTSGWFCEGNVRSSCWRKNYTEVSYADDCAQRGKVCRETGSGELGPATCVTP